MFIPKVVNSIVCNDLVRVDNKTDMVCYKVNGEYGIKSNIFVYIPKYQNPTMTSEITMENSEFVNGFKVVKLANDKFSYIREKDNVLVPFQYDIAFNFNEYGFAMVGKNGSVSWINKDFKYLNYKGLMVDENLDNWRSFEGWQGISDFNDSAIPLSRVFCGREEYGRTAYFTPDGEIKKFYQYNGTISNDVYRNEFYNGEDFNKNNLAFADDYILYSRGFCISKDDIIKLGLKDGFIDYLFDEAMYSLDRKNDEKVLSKRIH